MNPRVAAQLESYLPPATVKFDVNPERVVMTRAADVRSQPSASSNSGTPGGASGSIFRRAEAAQITLSKVTFYGPETKPNCDKLLDWMTPGGGLLGAAGGAIVSAISGGRINLASKLPLVMFRWGPHGVAFSYDVYVTRCNINYTRFAPSGMPIRAEVDITLQQQPSLLQFLGTNPTSGGVPGRRSHTVTQGESLAGIATEHYGSPGRWREIASTNGIEDPRRVRPGNNLYLPNPDELAEGPS